MREVALSKKDIMISTILVGNKQFSVSLGSRLRVEKLKLKQGDLWLGKEVLAIQKDEKEAIFGTPFVNKAQVKARIIRHGKAKKILILKKHRRKGYRRTLGHRQQFTEIYIEALSDSTGKWITKELKKSSVEKPKVKAKPQKKLQKSKTTTIKKVATKKPVKKRGS